MDQNVIHFIGIVLLSTHLASDGHLMAELPRIANPLTPARTRASDPWEGIEQHVAALAFKKADYDVTASSKNWPVKELNRDYWYVILDGERIRVYPAPQSTNTASNVGKRATPRGAAVDIDWQQQMPHLTADNLNDAYLEKGHFSGAAAVIDLPPGRAQGCKHGVNRWGHGGRVDLELAVPNSGKLIIEATSPESKKIVLNSGSRLYIGNVPRSSFGDTTTTNDPVSHNHAYAHMSTSSSAHVIPDTADPLQLPRCGPPTPPLDATSSCPNCRGTDYGCSNATWPAP